MYSRIMKMQINLQMGAAKGALYYSVNRIQRSLTLTPLLFVHIMLASAVLSAAPNDHSPNQLIFVAGVANAVTLGAIELIDADGSHLTPLAEGTNPAWSPDGTTIAFSSITKVSEENDPKARKTSLRPQCSIAVMNGDGTHLQTLLQRSSCDWLPQWSPDGKRIAFTSMIEEPFSTDLYVMNADGSDLQKMTRDGVSSHAAWSPDSQQIAFESKGDDIYGLLLKDPQPHRLTILSGTNSSPSWSPDGRSIAFISNREGSYAQVAFGIYIMNTDGSHQRKLVRCGFDYLADHRWHGVTFSWSPDGTKIAFSSDKTGRLQIYVMNRNGAHVRPVSHSAEDCDAPTWSMDGRQLSFLCGDPPEKIYVADETGDHLKQIARGFQVAWRPKPK